MGKLVKSGGLGPSFWGFESLQGYQKTGEWANGKVDALKMRSFVGSSPTSPTKLGISSIGRATGFDPVGLGFESLIPSIDSILSKSYCA